MKPINHEPLEYVLHRKYFFGYTKPHPEEFGKHIALRRPLGIRENRDRSRFEHEYTRHPTSNGLCPTDGVDRLTTPAWVAFKIQFALLLKEYVLSLC